MASYDYICKSCGQTKTVIRSISEKAVAPECKTCNILLSRVYSPIGVTFNGGGFYSTDKGK